MTKTQTVRPRHRGLLALAALASAALLSACGTPGSAIDAQAQARAMAARPTAPAEKDFPPIDSAKWKQGAFPSLEALRQMNKGMGKDQVRNLLSWPHFSEGMFGVEEWNYIFHLRTGNGPEFITCQYMVRFDDSMLTTGVYWKSPECEALATRQAAKPSPTPAPKPVVQPLPTQPAVASPPRKISLGADGMFRFGGAGLADLLPEGRRKVELLAAEIRRNFGSLRSISITGHTDRLGSASYNDALSLARANTVRDLLVREGIDAKLIQTAGAGKTRPIANCPGLQKTPALVACLQPNRRVELEVSGEQ